MIYLSVVSGSLVQRHGFVKLRGWLAVLGAGQEARSQRLERSYQPSFHAINLVRNRKSRQVNLASAFQIFTCAWYDCSCKPI